MHKNSNRAGLTNSNITRRIRPDEALEVTPPLYWKPEKVNSKNKTADLVGKPSQTKSFD